MEAKELRIGNYVEYAGETVKISGVTEENPFIDMITVDYLEYDEIFPIPLTEEWLVKLGFSEIGGCNEKDFTNGDYNIFINSIGEVNFLFFREGDWYQKISYVHQLQNLYFALTGEELTIKK